LEQVKTAPPEWAVREAKELLGGDADEAKIAATARRIVEEASRKWPLRQEGNA
jgi:hypothetical protein